MTFVCLHCWGNDAECFSCYGSGIQRCDRCNRQDATEMVENGYYCVECAPLVEEDYEAARALRNADRCDLPRALQYDYLDADAEYEEASLWGFRSFRALNDAMDRGEV